MEWIGYFVRGAFYALSIAFMFPFLILFRVDQRAPTVDDGFGDDDPGVDVDGEP